MLLHTQTRGFTLIELLVVISIMGFLSSTVLASVNSARIKSDNAGRVASVEEYKKALLLAYDANGRYPIIGTGSATEYCLGDYPPVAGFPNGKCADLAYPEEPLIYNEITPFIPKRTPLKSVPLFGGSFGGPSYKNGGTLNIGPPEINYFLVGINRPCGFGIPNNTINVAGSAMNINGEATACSLFLY